MAAGQRSVPLKLSAPARVVLLLLSLSLSALLLILSTRSFQAHRLVLAAEAQQLWGRLEEARESLRAALVLTPLDAGLYRTLGDLETLRHKWRRDPSAQDQALAAYATATALNPRDGKLFSVYAEGLLRAQRFAAAQLALQGALQRDPNNAVYHTLHGRLAEAEGDVGRALSAYRHAEAIKPNRERRAHIEELSASGK